MNGWLKGREVMVLVDGREAGTHVKLMSRTSTSSYDHLLKSLTVPISCVTSLGRTWYPLGFSTSTSPLSDMVAVVEVSVLGVPEINGGESWWWLKMPGNSARLLARCGR